MCVCVWGGGGGGGGEMDLYHESHIERTLKVQSSYAY